MDEQERQEGADGMVRYFEKNPNGITPIGFKRKPDPKRESIMLSPTQLARLKAIAASGDHVRSVTYPVVDLKAILSEIEHLRGMISYALDAPDDPAVIKKILRDALAGKGGGE